MEQSEIRKFLVRVLLDDGFRQLLANTPEEAFAEYTLTGEQKEILRRQDEAMLALIGAAVHETQTNEAAPIPIPAQPSQKEEPAARPAPQPSLPPPPDLPEVSFGIRIVPQTRYAPDGSLHVTYAASIHTIQPGADAQPAAPAPPPTPPQSAWGHQILSPAAQRAATAVKEANDKDRYSLLLELVAEIKGGAQ
ncbi:MAG: hypothetical protein HN348_25330 [Proteobacteria bacterium]|nr:hypothetical protein [Pseudomonadota bacterium]